jgi:hypothetical protein
MPLALNEMFIDENVRIWKEVGMAYFKILSREGV